MTFQPVLPWAILAVVAGALALARLVALRQVLLGAGRNPGRRIQAVLRWGGVTLVVLLLIGATTRPGWSEHENPSGTATTAGENLNVYLVVDRSAGSALADIRTDMAALLDRYPAARYALVTFDSRAALDWPLSKDVWSLRPTIVGLAAGPGRAAPSNADPTAAANVLRYQLIQAAQQYRGSRNVVLYFGSGAPGSRAPRGSFDLTPGSVDGGAVLGYGQGGTIDEAALRGFAAQLGVSYVHRVAGQPFEADLPDASATAGIVVGEAERVELYWVPALLAAGLLLAEIYLSVREFRRGRIARRDLAS